MFSPINAKINPFLWTSVTITGWLLMKRQRCSGCYLIILLITYCLYCILKKQKDIIFPVAAQVANFITSIWCVTIHNLANLANLASPNWEIEVFPEWTSVIKFEIGNTWGGHREDDKGNRDVFNFIAYITCVSVPIPKRRIKTNCNQRESVRPSTHEKVMYKKQQPKLKSTYSVGVLPGHLYL